MTETVAPAQSTIAASRSRERLTLLAVCGATFMLLVDVTIVQVALPSIQTRLHATFSDQEWVISGYALTLSALLLMMGSFADRFGRKRIFVLGVAEFTLASLACGLTPNALGLVLSRCAQGVGGAAMFATALALIGQEFQGPALGKAIAAWGATVGGAVAVGPLLGGALTSWLGWRSIFFVNVPIGIALVVLASSQLRNVTDPHAGRVDIGGVMTFSAMLFVLVFALIRSKDDGFASAPIVVMLAVAAVLLVAFVAIERRVERPMFDLTLFSNRSFVGVSVATFCIAAGVFGLLPYLTFYFQDYFGYSPFGGGLRLLPTTILTFAVPLASRAFTERRQPGPVLAVGLAISAAGIGLMTDRTIGATWAQLVPALLVLGLGIGVANPAIARVALGVVSRDRSGMASGISNTFRIGGLSIGVATLGAIFQGGISSSLGPGATRATIAKVASEGPRAFAATADPADLRVVQGAFLNGLNHVLVVGTGVTALGALVALLVRASDFHASRSAGPTTRAPSADAVTS